MERLTRHLPVLALCLVVVGAHLATAHFERQHMLSQFTMTAYYALVVVGLCALMGYAGQISIGHAGFFAIGGYISAALTVNNFAEYDGCRALRFADRLGGLVRTTDEYFGDEIIRFHPWFAASLAILCAVAVAAVIGATVLRLRGHYLAMATLGFGIIIEKIARGTAVFGEADGLYGVPPLPLPFGYAVNGDIGEGPRLENYYIAWGLVVVAMLLYVNLVRSRAGRALRAVHGSEEAAAASGVDVAGYKLRVFILSAATAAVAGVFLTHYNEAIGPSQASVMKSVRYVAIVAVGGMANLWGALVMAAILNALSLMDVFGGYDDAVFGGILVLVMLFCPNGLVRAELLRRVWAWTGGRLLRRRAAAGEASS